MAKNEFTLHHMCFESELGISFKISLSTVMIIEWLADFHFVYNYDLRAGSLNISPCSKLKYWVEISKKSHLNAMYYIFLKHFSCVKKIFFFCSSCCTGFLLGAASNDPKMCNVTIHSHYNMKLQTLQWLQVSKMV